MLNLFPTKELINYYPLEYTNNIQHNIKIYDKLTFLAMRKRIVLNPGRPNASSGG